MNVDFSDSKIIDGKALAKKREEKLEFRVKSSKFRVKVVSILIGDDPSSLLYAQMKQKKAHKLGIDFDFEQFPEDIEYEVIAGVIKNLNADPTVIGIMIQLPLPKKFLQNHKTQDLLDLINPQKDIDGLTSNSPFKTAAVVAVLNILEEENIQVKDKNAVVVGTSDLIGKPIAKGLEKRGAKVTSVNRSTLDKENIYKNADILISATGIPGLIKGGMVKEGVVVIDVGVMVIEEPTDVIPAKAGIYKNNGSPIRSGMTVSGDVDFESVYPKASKITPVPGGVGPMTVVALMENAVKAVDNS